MPCEVCDKPSGSYPLCKSCYIKKEDIKDKYDYKIPIDELRDVYFSTRNRFLNNTTNKSLYQTLICMVALAELEDDYYNDYLYRRLDKDFEMLKERSSKTTQNTTEEQTTKKEPKYEGKYVCKDGHIVKSKSELIIDNYLFENDIIHVYEKPFPVDAEHDIYPDFYLPKQNIYIEHWGYDETNRQYTEAKEYKLQIYKDAGITLICTEEQKDNKNLQAVLERKLKFVKEGEIN